MPTLEEVWDAMPDRRTIREGAIKKSTNAPPRSDRPPPPQSYVVSRRPDAFALIQEMIDAFVPSVRSEARLTQAQSAVVIRARQFLREKK